MNIGAPTVSADASAAAFDRAGTKTDAPVDVGMYGAIVLDSRPS
jgi:hypothetical protein